MIFTIRCCEKVLIVTGFTFTYRCELKGLFVLLSRTHTGPGRAIKQEQEENSLNHVQAFL